MNQNLGNAPENLTARPTALAKARRDRRHWPRVESCESRLLMTTGFLDGDILRIDGSEANDRIEISQQGTLWRINGVTGQFDARQVRRLIVNGLGGDDVIRIARPLFRAFPMTAEIDGGAGNDTIDLGRFLGRSSTTMLGGSGNDFLQAGDGNTWLGGNEGNDTLLGGNANDRADGGDGADLVRGGGGNDDIDGGSGNDQVDGGQGADNLRGGLGVDTLLGGNGNDHIEGGADNDIIRGENGNDRLFGNEGDDTLYGGDGNDFLDGGPGNDLLLGGNGKNTIIPGAGDPPGPASASAVASAYVAESVNTIGSRTTITRVGAGRRLLGARVSG